jgi:hypothetical protein
MTPGTAFLNIQNLTVGLGILMGLIWSRRTGWSCGGIITPGILALYASQPLDAAFALILGAALCVPLSLVSRALGLCGRERVGAAMLLALCARTVLSFLIPLHPMGWIIPGLVAADGERQGVGITLCSALSCAIVAAFGMTLLRRTIAGF